MAVIRSAAVGISLVFVSAVVTSGLAAPQPKSSYKAVDALLKAKCLKCHNDKRATEGVNVSSYKALMASGKEAKTVVAGKPDKSALLLYIDGTKKPLMPMGGKKLSDAEIKLVKDWIKAGAKP